ncbi:hypothetical protein GTU79_24670 [Sodalis ligni]|uniref:hypothetical protein n=1 Tax=Sodalis ligni TaxID=2697027 RepID=UPI001BDE13A4|nr:hypothetical protein [Sodalis ligni]QWA10376.1 hypothetical protein GTU79_24670 [Sodalis ligni]
MKRDENTLEVFAHSPLYGPKGMGFSGVLTSDMFGLRSDLDPKTLDALDEHAILLANEHRTDEEEIRFNQLQEELDMLGFLEAYSDPYFSEFVKAWARRDRTEQYKSTSLTESEREELSKMSDDILSELKREEEN